MSSILFEFINREKLFKAHKIQREFNEKSKSASFCQETEMKNLNHNDKRMTKKLEELEKKLDTNSKQTKELGNKLEEILKLLKPK